MDAQQSTMRISSSASGSFTCSQRRRRWSVALGFVLILHLSNGFLPRVRIRHDPLTLRIFSESRALSATKDEQQVEKETRSRPGSSSSRFGVRKRVRAVLEKAKNRTGVGNVNSQTLAEVASIGGLSDEYSVSFPSNLNEQRLQIFELDAMLNSNLPEEPLEPLPFTLPTLSEEQQQQLANGERVQEQEKMGREGSGFVVLDVKAPPYIVWECLLDFEAYPQNIGTVRSMEMYTSTHLKSAYTSEKPVLPGTGRETRHYGTASITRAKFVLSKFRLNIAAIHKYRPHPDGHYMVFTLDKANKNGVLRDAKGIWYTQGNPDGKGDEWTRVWLLCELKVSSLLPRFIVDYAARRAMPRATTWLVPTVEAARKRLLHGEDKEPPKVNGDSSIR